MRDLLKFDGLTAVFASSDLGDGVYQVFIGYDRAGRPASALIDLAVVDELFDSAPAK